MWEDTHADTPAPHRVLLDDRRSLTLSGVSDVDSFDEHAVIAYTSLGELTVKGDGLHLSRFNLENGELLLEGHIDALVYADTAPRSGGVFRRLFR